MFWKILAVWIVVVIALYYFLLVPLYKECVVQGNSPLVCSHFIIR